MLLQQFVGVLIGYDAEIAPSLAVVRWECLARTQLVEQCQNVAAIEWRGEREETLSGARRVTQRDGVEACSVSDVDVVLRRERVECTFVAVEEVEEPGRSAGGVGSSFLEYRAEHGVGQYGRHLERSVGFLCGAPDSALSFGL